MDTGREAHKDWLWTYKETTLRDAVLGGAPSQPQGRPSQQVGQDMVDSVREAAASQVRSRLDLPLVSRPVFTCEGGGKLGGEAKVGGIQKHRAASNVLGLTSLNQNPQHSCILGSAHIISGILLREGKGGGGI